MTFRTKLGAAAILLLLPVTALADETTANAADEPVLGPVTNLPLPRFVSVRAGKVNVRRGPSESHRVDWVFQLAHMPLEVTAEFGHWRRVRDIDGAGGWVHYALLSGERTVIVQKDYTPMRTLPFNLTGHPALALPPGSSDGMPLSLQIVGRAFDECRICRIGHALESAPRTNGPSV